MASQEENSAYLYEDALACADGVLGGNAQIKDNWTSAILYQARREPSPEIARIIDKHTDKNDHSDAPYKIGQLSAETVAALNQALNPLQTIEKSRRDLETTGIDPNGALRRNLDAIVAMVEFVLSKAGIDGRKPMSINEIREAAKLPPLQPINVSKERRMLKEKLGKALGRKINNDTDSLLKAYTELSSRWPSSSDSKRATIQQELLRQAQIYAHQVFPGMNLSAIERDIITHKEPNAYQITKLDGSTLICLPEPETLTVPADINMFASAGPTGYDLTARLTREGVRRGEFPPHGLSGLMFTSSVALHDGWAVNVPSEVARHADPEFFDTLGISRHDLLVQIHTDWLKDAVLAQAAFLAAKGLDEEQIAKNLINDFPVPPEKLKRYSKLAATQPLLAALALPRPYQGRKVVRAALDKPKKAGTSRVAEILKRVSGPHDTISVQQELAA